MKPQDRTPVLWLAAVSIFYFVCAGLRAMYRPMWYDELVAWHISRLPTIAAMWRAICSGVDQEMPLTHLTMRLSHALFGDGNLATRLPMLIGFWIMLMCIYGFLIRRLTWPYALLGLLFPMLTFMWPYSFEGRAYGISLAGTGIAMLSWQSAAEDRARPWSLAGIAFGLAVVLATQATLATVAIPFALGEAVRAYEKRRIDWPVWLAFAASCPVAIIYPIVSASVRAFHFPGMQPGIQRLPAFFDDALLPAVFPLLLALGAACWIGRKEKRVELPQAVLPRHEAAMLFGFLLTPLPFFLLGRLTNQYVFFPRYGMLAMIGLAGWLAVFAFRMAAGSFRVAMSMVLILFVWLVAARGKEAFALAHDPNSTWLDDWQVLAKTLSKGPPVVVSSNLVFLEGDHYFSADLASHLYWVTADPDVAQAHAWTPFSDFFTTQDTRNFPVRAHLVPWKEFGARTEPFYLYIDTQHQWFYDVLPREGWRLTEQSVNDGWILFWVEKEKR
jgi:hypothetical protein